MGKGIRKIAEELNQAKKTKKTKAKWDYSAVYYILSNVRYKGDALFQKTYTMGFPYKSRLNRGERPQYYLHHANPGIISAEEYEQVQSIRLEKSKKHYKGTPEKSYSFSKMIFCKECGTLYRFRGRQMWIRRDFRYIHKICICPVIQQTKGKHGIDFTTHACSSRALPYKRSRTRGY